MKRLTIVIISLIVVLLAGCRPSTNLPTDYIQDGIMVVEATKPFNTP